MKKASLFFLLFLLLTIQTAIAGNISLEKARKAAENFMSQGSAATRATGGKLTLVNVNDISSTRSGENEPAFYIFNREGGGFVIISAVDAAKPVLGYSFEHSFGSIDEIPENLADWLDGYRSQIEEWRLSGKETTPEEAARWEAVMSKTKVSATITGGKDLCTADWGQGDPFNGKCPLDNTGKRSLVGCTNTAISEVLYYHRYPESGTGTLPGYTSKKNDNIIEIPSITLGEKYKWDKMLPKYSGVNYTQEQADAVASLCYHIAVMSKASFSSSATSASTKSAVPRLVEYFGYDNGFTRYSSDLFSYDDWFKLLKDCVDNDFPVIYTGRSESDSGHSFVVDGYDEGGRILINFGWNGSSNGYYEIGSFGKYVRDNSCWVYVRPETGGKDTGYMSLAERKDGGYCGLRYISGTPAAGSSISILFGSIVWNSNGSSFEGKLNFRLMDKNGVSKCWVHSGLTPSSPIENGKSRYWKSQIKLSIPSDITIERGDYIAVFYNETPSLAEGWKPAAYQDAEISIKGRIYCHIADFTSATFDAKNRILGFYTFSDARCTVTDSSGKDITGNLSYADGVLIINTNNLSSGKYSVTFSSGDQTTSISFVI